MTCITLECDECGSMDDLTITCNFEGHGQTVRCQRCHEALRNSSGAARIMHLLDLAEQLPEGVRADWRDTNHYELTVDTIGVLDANDDYWWLTLDEFVGFEQGKMPCKTEKGQRVGLLLDLAEALKDAEPELRALLANA